MLEDLDADGVITADEVRAANYQRQFSAREIKHVVIEDAEHTKHRYTPAQERMLKKLEHSKRVWADQKNKDAKDKAKADGDADAKVNVRAPSFDVWIATEAGKTSVVKRYIMETGYDVRDHNDSMKWAGSTMLHVAAWNGHVELVEFLLDHVAAAYGEDDLDDFVNSWDTMANQATPLLLAARTMVGSLKDRLKICRTLVDAGADVEAQDAHGDNALHWAARRSQLPIVRYLVEGTEGAVFASNADNFQRQKPLDIAIDEDTKRWRQTEACEHDPMNYMMCTSCGVEHYGSYQTVECYRILLSLMKGSNMRLKIRKGEARRLAEEKRIGEAIRRARIQAIEHAHHLLAKTNAEFKRQRQVAEDQRAKEELDAMNEKGEEGVAMAEKFIKTKEGKRKLKDYEGNIERVMREEWRAEGKKINRDFKKIKEAKAKAQLFGEMEDDARNLAQKKFRDRNPPEEVREPHKNEFRDIKAMRAKLREDKGALEVEESLRFGLVTMDDDGPGPATHARPGQVSMAPPAAAAPPKA